TGAVGREMLAVLEQRRVTHRELRLFSSARSAGSRLPFANSQLEVRELNEDSFDGCDLALFSAGSSISKQFAPIAVERGCTVVDNSSAFRMQDDVPLVVPEINDDVLDDLDGP